jgi:argininosuccinate synthase
VVGRRSPHGLYDHALATCDAGDQFHHTAAEGLKIWGLPIETAARRAVESGNARDHHAAAPIAK